MQPLYVETTVHSNSGPMACTSRWLWANGKPDFHSAGQIRGALGPLLLFRQIPPILLTCATYSRYNMLHWYGPPPFFFLLPSFLLFARSSSSSFLSNQRKLQCTIFRLTPCIRLNPMTEWSLPGIREFSLLSLLIVTAYWLAPIIFLPLWFDSCTLSLAVMYEIFLRFILSVTHLQKKASFVDLKPSENSACIIIIIFIIIQNSANSLRRS